MNLVKLKLTVEEVKRALAGRYPKTALPGDTCRAGVMFWGDGRVTEWEEPFLARGKQVRVRKWSHRMSSAMITDRVKAVNDLIADGTMPGKACRMVGLNRATFYVRSRAMRGGRLADS